MILPFRKRCSGTSPEPGCCVVRFRKPEPYRYLLSLLQGAARSTRGSTPYRLSADDIACGLGFRVKGFSGLGEVFRGHGHSMAAYENLSRGSM